MPGLRFDQDRERCKDSSQVCTSLQYAERNIRMTEKEITCPKCHTNSWKITRPGNNMIVIRCTGCGALDVGLIN
jgi:hypothetical protein